MKRKGIALLAILMLCSACIATVIAATPTEVNTAGFYHFGTATDITITPQDESNSVAAQTVLVDGVQTTDYYPNAIKMKVDFSDAKDSNQYLVLLVSGNSLPTVDSQIYYVNQLSGAELKANGFNVYPILPEADTDLTLFITTDDSSQATISVPLKYHVPYTLGDVNADGVVDSDDALKALRYCVKLEEPTELQKLAADVNHDAIIDSDDALKILRYCVRLITSWD